MQKVKETAAFLQEKYNNRPTIGLILGSGLGVLAEQIEDSVHIPYEEIPNFPVSTVVGHEGKLVFGKIHNKTVVAMQGRFHYYEGYSLAEVTFPVRVMKELGAETLIVTNAAGGINTSYQPGDLMLISDHINFTGNNPLIGPNTEQGVRFPDMSESYSSRLRNIAKQAAKTLQIPLQEGVYIGFSGPSYETPAEIRMARQLGADAVGMSTVPEVIVARHATMEVLGISCISNFAAGILEQPLSHEEVIETTEKAKARFLSLVKEVIKEL